MKKKLNNIFDTLHLLLTGSFITIFALEGFSEKYAIIVVAAAIALFIEQFTRTKVSRSK